MHKLTHLLGMMSLCCMGVSSYAFEIHGTGTNLVADGGIDSPFIAITQNGTPFVAQSATHAPACQGEFMLDGLAVVGSVADGQDTLAVFASSADIVFTLHAKYAGKDWQAISTPKTLPCHDKEPLSFKATFYRQSQVTPLPSLTRTIHKSFSLKDQAGTRHPISLNTTLNFAKPVQTYSCKVVYAQQNITLDKISVQELNEQKRIQNGNSADFILDCNSAKATVMAMVYDNFDPSNFGADKTILSVKSGGAKGVGIQLYKDGEVLKLGQKTAYYRPTDDGTQWKIDGGDNRTLQLKAGYIKTGEISSGTVQAQAGLVFFYP